MKTLVLALSFAILAGQTVFADSLQMATARKAFLLDLKTRVTAMYDLNHVHIQHLLTCIQKVSDEEFRAIGPVNPQKHDPWANCTDGLAQIKQNTKLRYPLARRTLLLSQLVSHEGINQLLNQLYLHVQRGKNNTIRRISNERSLFSGDIVIENPLTTWLSEEELPKAEWTREEILDVLQEDNGDTTKKDANFNTIFREACTHKDLKTPGQFWFRYCKDTTLRYSEKDHGIVMSYEGTADKKKILLELERASAFFQGELQEDKKRLDDRYKALIQGNPYVALVTSANPPRHEFERALQIMLQRSETAIKQHTAFRKKNELDSTDKANLDAMLTLMIHNPVSQSVADNPGPELGRVLKLMPFMSANEVREDLISSHFWQEMRRLGIEVGTAVALNTVACWLPVSRPVRAGSVLVSMLGKTGRIADGTLITTVLKLERVAELFNRGNLAKFMGKAFSPLCYSVGGLAVNVWFLHEAIDQYNDVYRQVFSSVEEESLMREVEALPDKEREIFWSLVTIPMGTGAANYLKAKLPKISQALGRLVESRMAKLRVQPPPLPAPAG